jgi:hypothetical protein
MNTNTYIKTDDNKIINERQIRWVKKMNDCMEVCIAANGCRVSINTHTICKQNSPESYNKLFQHFEKDG